MKRQARSSKESSYGYGPSAEATMARAQRASSHSLSRTNENNNTHPSSHPYSYSHSRIDVPDRFDYEEDEGIPVLQRLPSQERVPQSDFLGNADLILDDPLQRWKLIEADRDYVSDEGGNSRRHHTSRYDRPAAVGSVGVPRHSPHMYQQDDYGMQSSTFVPSYSRYGRDVAIVSPVFDDCGEQSYSSRNSLQRTANEWDELKPPPLSSNDHLYHHNHYQREEEESYHRRFSNDRSYGSRDYRASAAAPAVPTAKMMEISPGSFVRLRGAEETYQAVANDFYTPCQCMICTSTSPSKYYRKGDEEPLFCIQDADFFLCPNCKSICPLEEDASSKRSGGAGGVGLGFTLEMLIQIQEEIVSHRSAAH
jgi:hypothetical protein